jgi:hypothetical protein
MIRFRPELVQHFAHPVLAIHRMVVAGLGFVGSDLANVYLLPQ